MNPNNYEDFIQNQDIAGQVGDNASRNAQAQYYFQEAERGLAENQLDVEEILSEIYHWLRQDIKEENENGKIEWKTIKDSKQRTLSDMGVDKIMGKLHFYINKNTLLSSLDEIQINRIMLRFVKELNSLLFLKYQVIFKQLTFEECREILNERIEGRKKMRKYAIEILGKTADEEQIHREVLKEMEAKIEKEMEKIREEKRKEQIREYGSIMAQLEHIVFFCLNRAYRGEERASIRRHTNISEVVGARPIQEPKGRGIFKWGRDSY